MALDAAVAAKLQSALGHDRVYPDARWLTTDPDTGEPIRLAELPVVMYRQTGGSGSESLNADRGGLRDDFFLVEVFADGRDDCTTVKDALLDAFKGPLSDAWETWGTGSDTARVHWAQIDDPEAGAEFPDSEPHLLFRFVRMVLQVQWNKE